MCGGSRGVGSHSNRSKRLIQEPRLFGGAVVVGGGGSSVSMASDGCADGSADCEQDYAADRQSARPTVAGLFFPVITLGPDAHAQSKREMLGTDTSEARIRRFSAENDLPADMPPTFVAHAANDPVVPPANSLRMFAALQAAKIPSELMIFELGGHGLPLVQPGGKPHPWPDLFLAFAGRHGI